MEQRKTTFFQALITVAVLGVIMFLSIVKFDASPHIPMLLGCGIAGCVALWAGYKWEDVEEGMISGIHQALESLIILMLIGVLVSTWIQAGTVPAMICYGLQLLSPRFYLVTTMVICSVISMAVGSWGTAGTVGLAFIGIASALGIPLPLAAGAIVSGSYVGDKLSPLSDSTNLASAVTGVNVFDNVRHMFPIAGGAYLLAAVIYAVIGFQYGAGGAEAMANVGEYVRLLRESFWISPLALLPLMLLVVCICVKIPAIPSIGIGILAAAVQAMITQGAGMGDILTMGYSGYVSHTGNEMLDTLLTAGGMEAMLFSVSMIMVAMMFGGIMEKTGQMEALMAPVMKLVHSVRVLVTATVMSCIAVNLILPEQYIAIAIPGRMYANEYDKRQVDRKDLAVALGAGGAATSALVPWNTCGIYMPGVLGVSTFAYMPFAFFNLMMPLAMILATGFIQNKREQTSNKY